MISGGRASRVPGYDQLSRRRSRCGIFSSALPSEDGKIGRVYLAFAIAVLLGGAALGADADWPQWQGPDRTRVSKETGLLKSGPRAAHVWSGRRKDSDPGSGRWPWQVIASSCKAPWPQQRRHRTQSRGWKGSLVEGSGCTSDANDRGPGPRGTPTVDGDRIYVLTENGDLACLMIDGTAVWQRNILRDFGGSQLNWLISESPLVDGPHVVVSPGGRGAGMVKLDKLTGKTVWTSKDLSDRASYSSIIAADVQGVRTYITFTASAGVGVRASDGKLMFRYPNAANGTANVATPIYSNNKVFFTSGIWCRRGAARSERAERRGRGERGVLHRKHEEPPRRRRAGRRVSLRVQRRHP